MNKKGWFVVATGAIVLSLVSLLLPIVIYTNADGITRSFNLFGIVSEDFRFFVFPEYRGELFYNLSYSTIAMLIFLFAVIGVGAIVLAFVGINSMSKQYESSTPFTLAVLGLVGTALPSIALFFIYLASFAQYLGTMHLGPYIFVTPLAMIAAIVAVTARHRLSREEAQARAAASAYIRVAGDLPMVGYYAPRQNGGYNDPRRSDYYGA